jgi:NAD-dependent deacetylase
MGHFMLAPNLKAAIDGLADLVENADAVLLFTGAGISTECGIPDFRSPGGIWARMQPIPFDAFMASREMRDEAWRRRFAMEDEFKGARPGRGHLALASLYKAGKAPGVITQNIDNLHQESGIAPADVVELHGNTTYALCLGCLARYELPWVRQKFEAAGGRAPDCDCGGHIKTATISFGQAMPEATTWPSSSSTTILEPCWRPW